MEMEKSEKNQYLEQLDAYVHALMQELRIMEQRKAILEPLLFDEDLKSSLNMKFKDTDGAVAYNHFVPLLAQDLIRDISRLFLDEGKKAGSFTNLCRKISNKKQLGWLRERYCESQVINPNELASEFHNIWDNVKKGKEKIMHDPNSEKLKTFRDKYYAHLEMTPMGNEPGPFNIKALGLTYCDIFNFLDTHQNVIYNVALMITGTNYDNEEFLGIHRKSANEMWRLLAGE
uniref:HEPN AbiU2-like domain-containing protein n=1 Tax=Chlorobium chlorochromatii (strain CaD3) TaxID=340177 RepID=Q3ATX1_CHLCH